MGPSRPYGVKRKMTKFPDLFAALAAPFETHEVKIRPAQGGRQLHYITARTAMNRLDEILGPENWWDEYSPSQNSVQCKLTVRLPDGSTVTKCDAGGYAGMADSGDDDKSGFSDAFKRAAAKFGVARYLYRDGVPTFAAEPAAVAASAPQPQAPAQQAAPARSREVVYPRSDGVIPRTGKALFGWLKDQEKNNETGLLRYVSNWGKLQEYPTRMIDWNADQVSLAYNEVTRKLESRQPPARKPTRKPWPTDRGQHQPGSQRRRLSHVSSSVQENRLPHPPRIQRPSNRRDPQRRSNVPNSVSHLPLPRITPAIRQVLKR